MVPISAQVLPILVPKSAKGWYSGAMRRILIEKMVQWKGLEDRKPLLLDGARQVGKTYLLEFEFGAFYFDKVHKFDFREKPALANIFNDSLAPERIIRSLELEIGEKINLQKDLIFFDEVGECQGAIDSLKYFSEKMPQSFICASGSNIGLLSSFPVGKTYNLELFPMNYYEFLLASGNQLLIEEFEKQSRLMKTHEKLWELLLDYYFVGGMPEAVNAWFALDNIIDKIAAVNQVHKDLISGYTRDFGKYGGKANALHLEAIFRLVPSRLQETRDGSVKRFLFKDVVEGKKRYAELRGPIDWLEKSKLISKNLIVSSRPKVPLVMLTKENIFKLFFFDLGLLCHFLGLSYQTIVKQDFSSKGFIAENFVQNELRVCGEYPLFSWQEGTAEIEFLLTSKSGEIYPLEVKSGKRTKAKSLSVYLAKYNPQFNFKLIGARGASEDRTDHCWPLYYASYVLDI